MDPATVIKMKIAEHIQGIEEGDLASTIDGLLEELEDAMYDPLSHQTEVDYGLLVRIKETLEVVRIAYIYSDRLGNGG